MEHLQLQRLLSTRIKRRGFILGSGALTGLAVASQWRRVIAQPKFSDNPFKLGVASGDPLPDSVVLWTRLAPEPVNGGGIPSQPVPVQWQIARDENMNQVVQRGEAMAEPELGHSVHVEVGGLEPDRWYWYQFKAGSEVSPVGRTRSAPPPGAPIDRFRFAVASCQMYEHGYFTAYKHMAEEDLDLVIHLGDYIYEYGPREYEVDSGTVRLHEGPEIISLEDYRNRHALYKTDEDLQAAHASFPWLVTWDDHEFENDYADEIPEEGSQQEGQPEAFLQRRAAAYQAYWEHMPMRPSRRPRGPDMPLYRRFTFGDLAEFNVVDTRQYRSNQPCGDGLKPYCDQALSPEQTIMGAEQERWLLEGLDRSQSIWNIIAQQVLLAQLDLEPGSEAAFLMDKWDGYVAERDRLLNFIQERQPSNPVVLTGDIHSNWVANLKADFDNPDSPTLGTEFVVTSISANGDGSDTREETEGILADNPHIKFFNGQRGYVRCDLNRDRWQSTYRIVPFVSERGAPIRTVAQFVVENGRPGAQQV